MNRSIQSVPKSGYPLFLKLLLIIGAGLLWMPLPLAGETMTPRQERLYDMGFGVLREEMAAPGFTLRDLDGNRVSLDEHRGSVVLLNLWATWCPACVTEKGSMQRLYNRYKDQNFQLLTIAIPDGQRETEETLLKYMDTNNYSFPVLLDPEAEVFMQYSTGSIPVSWIIDTQGYLVARQMGARDWDTQEIRQVVRELMNN